MGLNNNPFSVGGAFDSKEGERRNSNLIKKGKIVEARYDVKGAPPDPNLPNYTNEDTNKNYRGPLYRVEIGDHKTYWIPQLERRSGKDQSYWAFEVGEQVIIACPDGDMRQAVVIGALACNDFRPPVGFDDETIDKRPWRETVHRIKYQDGTLVEYDRKKHRLLIVFPDGSKIQAQQSGGTELNVQCSGSVTIESSRTSNVASAYYCAKRACYLAYLE
jgi:phage baseplate assembly protein V